MRRGRFRGPFFILAWPKTTSGGSTTTNRRRPADPLHARNAVLEHCGAGRKRGAAYRTDRAGTRGPDTFGERLLVSRLVPDANPAHDAVWNLGDQRKGLACADNDHSNEHDHIQDVHDGRVAAVDVVDGLGETFAHEPAEELEDDVAHEQYEKNGRASCRERVCRYV